MKDFYKRIDKFCSLQNRIWIILGFYAFIALLWLVINLEKEAKKEASAAVCLNAGYQLAENYTDLCQLPDGTLKSIISIKKESK
ncbi:MAG: hypothetical protein WCT18_05000 [Patescibacteria group bacterium]